MSCFELRYTVLACYLCRLLALLACHLGQHPATTRVPHAPHCVANHLCSLALHRLLALLAGIPLLLLVTPMAVAALRWGLSAGSGFVAAHAAQHGAEVLVNSSTSMGGGMGMGSSHDGGSGSGHHGLMRDAPGASVPLGPALVQASSLVLHPHATPCSVFVAGWPVHAAAARAGQWGTPCSLPCSAACRVVHAACRAPLPAHRQACPVSVKP